MSLPTAKQIMKLFLYGTELPVDFVREDRIRPDSSPKPWIVDKNEYMDSVGRFATLASVGRKSETHSAE